MVNAMTVDVEDYFHVAALAKVISPKDWDGMEYRAEESTRRLLDLFASQGIRATFFVLGWVARRSPELVRTIQAAGHEIASHRSEEHTSELQSRRDLVCRLLLEKKKKKKKDHRNRKH